MKIRPTPKFYPLPGVLFVQAVRDMNRPSSVAASLHEPKELPGVAKEFASYCRAERSASLLHWSCFDQAIPRRPFNPAWKQRTEDTRG